MNERLRKEVQLGKLEDLCFESRLRDRFGVVDADTEGRASWAQTRREDFGLPSRTHCARSQRWC
jgi:hypothetical protein